MKNVIENSEKKLSLLDYSKNENKRYCVYNAKLGLYVPWYLGTSCTPLKKTI
jgi:hypothetical protein